MKYKEENTKIKYIDILDSEGKVYFDRAMDIFLSIFKEDKYYVKVMRKILKRKLHPNNTIFRIMVAVDRKTDKVIGVCIYRHWVDINYSTLEYLMAKLSLRGKGIGSLLYNRLKKDLRAIGSKGLFFSRATDIDLNKYNITDKWKTINTRRAKFYEERGARPIKGIIYDSPAHWNDKQNIVVIPLLCFDSLKKPIEKRKIRIRSELVKEVVKRIMMTYYNVPSKDRNVRRILKSIKTQSLSLKKSRHIEK